MSEEKFLKKMGEITSKTNDKFSEMQMSHMEKQDENREKASDAIKSGGSGGGSGIDEKDKTGISDEAMEDKKPKT